MERIRALCAAGGDTEVLPGSWEVGSFTERVWIGAPRLDGVTVVRGVCVRPVSCPFRDLCTGKVRFSNEPENEFTQAIIHELVTTDQKKFMGRF